VPYDATTDELIRQAHSEGPARWAAFVALAHDLSRRAYEVLRESARDGDPYTRRAAVEAIGCRPPDPSHVSIIVRAW
jgi:HEAT repeat protein